MGKPHLGISCPAYTWFSVSCLSQNSRAHTCVLLHVLLAALRLEASPPGRPRDRGPGRLVHSTHRQKRENKKKYIKKSFLSGQKFPSIWASIALLPAFCSPSKPPSASARSLPCTLGLRRRSPPRSETNVLLRDSLCVLLSPSPEPSPSRFNSRPHRE